MGQDSAKQMRSVGSGDALGMVVNFIAHYVSVVGERSEIDRPQMRQGRMRADTSEMRSPNREWAGTWLAPARPTALYAGQGAARDVSPLEPPPPLLHTLHTAAHVPGARLIASQAPRPPRAPSR